ncbi:MAG: LysM peptidoglycan-binding domain-containing protein [Oligoflexales bacterium]
MREILNSSISKKLIAVLFILGSVSCATTDEVNEENEESATELIVYEEPFLFPLDEVVEDSSEEADLFEEPSAENPSYSRFKNHKVRRGDWLSKLAARYYGDKELWHDILAANPGIKPNLIRPGQLIKIPDL